MNLMIFVVGFSLDLLTEDNAFIYFCKKTSWYLSENKINSWYVAIEVNFRDVIHSLYFRNTPKLCCMIIKRIQLSSVNVLVFSV